MDEVQSLAAFRDAVTRQAQFVRDRVAGLSEIQFNWKAGGAVWSVGQCLQHVNMVGRHWVKAFDVVAAAGVAGDGAGPFRLGRAGRYAMKPYVRKPFRLRKPVVRTRFRPHFSVYSIGCLNEFFEIRDRLLTLGSALAAMDAGRNAVRMPRFPFLRIPLGDAYPLVAAHADYFLRYAAEVRNLAGFPRA